jgi:predicted nucleotidyltransferase
VIHHEETIAAFTDVTRDDPEALGLVAVGSVARGNERPDSDVDVYVVVTEDRFERAREQNQLSYVDTASATYEGGYVDVKLVSPRWVRAVGTHADEPTRASLLGARVVWSSLPGLEEAIRDATADADESVWNDRLSTAVARMRLHGGYFLTQGVQLADPLLAHAAAAEFVRAAGQALLAHAHVLYAGPKYLRSALNSLPHMPDTLISGLERLVREPDPQHALDIMIAVESLVAAPLTPEATLGRFVADNELAWLWSAPWTEERPDPVDS